MAIQIEKNIPIPGNQMGKLPVNPETGLNEREEKYVEAVLTADKGTLTKKVQEIYKEEGTDITYKSASVRAAELRKSKGVMNVLQEYEQEAQQGIVEIAKYATTLGKMGGKEGAAYATVGLNAHDKILDRVHGKAKQSLDITTKSVTINMDLTQALPEESNG